MNNSNNTNYLGQSRQNLNTVRPNSMHFRQQSLQTKNTSQRRFERPVPMNVEHIEECEEVNFHCNAQTSFNFRYQIDGFEIWTDDSNGVFSG